MSSIHLNEQWFNEEIGVKMKNFLGSNENNSTMYQNLWHIAKAVLRGKIIAVSTHIRD